MLQRQWWERPRLQSDEEGARERRVDWHELFFDLVFVVVIAELAHYLATHLSLSGVAGYALLFVPAWWVWIGGVFYNERFETYDISVSLFTFGLMIPVAAIALFVHDALGATSTGFALAYATARARDLHVAARGVVCAGVPAGRAALRSRLHPVDPPLRRLRGRAAAHALRAVAGRARLRSAGADYDAVYPASHTTHARRGRA